jgi:integrase/recombinase XerC
MPPPDAEFLPSVIPPDPPATPAVPTPADLLELLLAGLKPQSREAYTRDLDALARFLRLPSAGPAAVMLLSLTRARANALASVWCSDMLERGLSPATVRRRYAAMCRVFKAGRRLGLTEVTPEAELPRTTPLRDTAGPGKRGWEQMLAVAKHEAQWVTGDGLRNLAIILLLHDRGLRRGEVVALDWPADFDATKPAVAVLGKGKLEKEWLTVSDRAAAAVVEWATWHPGGSDRTGPLFTRLDGASEGLQRLTGHAVNDLVKALARRAGLPRVCRAHGLRHQAVTEALDAGWSVRDAMAFSRHVDPKTVMLYDDRRKDVGGEISKALGGERRGPRKKPRGPV